MFSWVNLCRLHSLWLSNRSKSESYCILDGCRPLFSLYILSLRIDENLVGVIASAMKPVARCLVDMLTPALKQALTAVAWWVRRAASDDGRSTVERLVFGGAYWLIAVGFLINYHRVYQRAWAEPNCLKLPMISCREGARWKSARLFVSGSSSYFQTEAGLIVTPELGESKLNFLTTDAAASNAFEFYLE